MPAGQSQHRFAATCAESIAFGDALAQIRGHLLASLELYRAGDQSGRRPCGASDSGNLPSVRSALDEHGGSLGSELEEAMEVGASAIRDGKPVAELDSVYHDAAAITRRAQDAVVDRSADDAHKGSVIAALLMTASDEYEEAVGERGVRLVAEYEDAAAAELSTEAYLENYELIEGEVIEKAPDINSELEPLLGARLRRRLQEGASVPEIRQMVARAKKLLAEAVEAPGEGH
jgi:hypothetical protein